MFKIYDIRPLTFIFPLICLIYSTGCKKLVEVDPPVTNPDGAVIYSNNASAASVMTGLYARMGGSGSIAGQEGLSELAGLTADELQAYPSYDQVIQHAYTNSFSTVYAPYLWTAFYNYIYAGNDVIGGLSQSTGVTAPVKQQLMGEAKFIRALFYFYLVNLYGDVPLVTTTDYQVNAKAARTAAAQIYTQITADLNDARNLLSNNFLNADVQTISTSRVRPTSWAAAALLARVYLYEGIWDSAYSQSTAVINNSSMFTLDTLNAVFLANSTEAIWQVQPTTPGYNTLDANIFILTAGPNPYTNFVSLNDSLYKAFEPGDNRLNDWVGTNIANGITYYYPNKYKIGNYNVSQPITEYLMILRLGEQYLIRAEAEANGAGAGIPGAITDLNTIRTRAGLPGYSGASDQASLLAAILHERQVELFTELGHRWLDLKRTNNINNVMGSPGNICASKGGVWSPDWALYPIPLTTIQADANVPQNPGYQ
jgi:hypothetical protein